VVCEATKEYPDEKYPGEEDASARQSVYHHLNPDVIMSVHKRPTERRIDFSNPNLVIRYYAEKFGAGERQVVPTMLSVQTQLDKGT